MIEAMVAAEVSAQIKQELMKERQVIYNQIGKTRDEEREYMLEQRDKERANLDEIIGGAIARMLKKHFNGFTTKLAEVEALLRSTPKMADPPAPTPLRRTN
jgi:hypothetical protein